MGVSTVAVAVNASLLDLKDGRSADLFPVSLHVNHLYHNFPDVDNASLKLIFHRIRLIKPYHLDYPVQEALEAPKVL